MTAANQDIRFECHECSQHLVVDVEGAGMNMECPCCQTGLTVPAPGARRVTKAPSERAVSDLSALWDAPSEDSKLGARETKPSVGPDHSAASEELGRLQQQIKSLTDECERLAASHTHTHAELKSFQSERTQSKTELSTARRRVAELETALAERVKESAEFARESAEARARAAALEAQLPSVGAPAPAEAGAPANDGELLTRVASLEAKLRTAEEGRAALASEAATLRQDRAAVTESLHTVQAEVVAEAARRAEAETALENLQQHHAAALAQLELAQTVAEKAQRAAADLKQQLEQAHADREREIAAAAESARAMAGEGMEEWRTLIADLETALSNARVERDAALAERSESVAREAETARTLEAMEGELQTLEHQLAELEAVRESERGSLAQARADVAYLQRCVEQSKAPLAELAELRPRLADRERELSATIERLHAAECSCHSLTTCSNELRRELEDLREDLRKTNTGRDLVDLRARFEKAESEHREVEAKLGQVEEELRKALVREAAERESCGEAQREIEALTTRIQSISESKVTKDNEVLRGIVARQNGELAQRLAEIHRFKRAQYAVKITYALFGFGALVLVIFALKVLPPVLKF